MSSSSKKPDFPWGFIISISIGTIIITLVLLIIFLKWKKQIQEDLIPQRSKSNRVMPSELEFTEAKKERLSIDKATFQVSLLHIKPSDIISATKNFSKDYMIDNGENGSVYKTLLPNGQRIAVKRVNGGHIYGDRQFSAEIETIGKIKHVNLVPLIGYSIFADEKLLIYEYMENGNLEFWLRNRSDLLHWETRLNICLGLASGIAFLHHEVSPRIIHRDIKSSNILLDGNFEPRVSDFGLARLISDNDTHLETTLFGTPGYIPPEYVKLMVATTKGDVYSFGVVMLEVLTGSAPIGQLYDEGDNLVGWVKWMSENGRKCEVFDPCCYNSIMSKYQMLQVLDIATSCTEDDPRRRPTMLDVVNLLNNAKLCNDGIDN